MPSLRGHLYYRSGANIYHFEPNSVITRELERESITARSLDYMTVDLVGPSARFLSILLYKGMRRMFKRNGYVCGGIGGRRANNYQNLCMDRAASNSIQGVVLGRCHQGLRFYMEVIHGAPVLTLTPEVKLMVSVSEVMNRNMVDLAGVPHTFAALGIEPDQSALASAFLVPDVDSMGNYVKIQDTDRQISINAKQTIELPLQTVYFMPSITDQYDLGLSEQFADLHAHRYAGKVRDLLQGVIGNISKGRKWEIEFAPNSSVVFDSEFQHVG